MNITDKQKSYIESLLKKKNLMLTVNIENISKQEGSNLIGYLLDKPDALDMRKFVTVKTGEKPPLVILPGDLFPVDDDDTLPF